jgi:hypothetical protein
LLKLPGCVAIQILLPRAESIGPIRDSDDDGNRALYYSDDWRGTRTWLTCPLALLFVIRHLTTGGALEATHRDEHDAPPPQFALTAHVTFSVGWLGSVAGFLALAVPVLGGSVSELCERVCNHRDILTEVNMSK